MSNFPLELMFDILSWLPPKDLIRSLCVSKAWYAFIHDQRFTKAHLQRSIETNSATLTILFRLFKDPPSNFFSSSFSPGKETMGTAVKIEQPLKCPDSYTYILGYSVHGIVLIHDNNERNIAFWNPSIQKFKKIPFPTFELEEERRRPVFGIYGFGYDSINDDYKLMRVEFKTLGYGGHKITYKFIAQVQIYSLKSNSWKRIQNMPPCSCFRFNNRVPASNVIFLNGALCWLMLDVDELSFKQMRPGYGLDPDVCREVIISFNLTSEKYCQFSTPAGLDGGIDTMGLEVLGDCLCLCVRYFKPRHDVWVMKEYGVTKSWSRLYSFEGKDKDVPRALVGVDQPLVLSKNGEMVLLTDKDRKFFWYDLEKKSFKQVEFPGRPSRTIRKTVICWWSLCLLDGDPVIAEPERQHQVPTTYL